MLRVVETFSGIGSQAKALKNANIEHEILCTVEWDINAIIAYDLIHNGKQDLSKYENTTKTDLLDKIRNYTLSTSGKKPASEKALRALSEETLKRLIYSIERSNNLVSITDVKGIDLPNQIDLLTYSFPCQDLSVAGYWHGNKGGIDRNAHNRSGMLWEIERILKERIQCNLGLPKFLLMENVSNILSSRHKKNFDEWVGYLEKIGYYNKVYVLDSSNFGIPQKRVRAYMISVLVGGDEIKRQQVKNYFATHSLDKNEYVEKLNIKSKKLSSFLKLDYNNLQYLKEADACRPNNTVSRQDIYRENEKLVVNGKVATKFVPTITTKQDRHPNSGVIDYKSETQAKCGFRYLTPRECFLLMGFDEVDYQNIIESDFQTRGKKFFTLGKLNKMAGNSIVVNVLEEIFKQIEYINANFFEVKKQLTLKEILEIEDDSYVVVK